MFSQFFNTADLSAPLPRWAVVVSLALIVVITAILVFAMATPPKADDHAATSEVNRYFE